jgi:hypothetical protein
MNRVTVTWGALLITLTLLGCAGRAQDGSNTLGGSGGTAGASGGTAGASGGTAGAGAHDEGGEAGEIVIGEGGAGGSAPIDLHLLGASSWDVTVLAKYPEGILSDPAPILATLALQDMGNLAGLLSQRGQSSTFALTRDSGTRAQLAAPESGVRFSLVGAYPLTALTLQKLTLTAFDDDSDGTADRIEGSGEGTVEESCGDCYFTRSVTLTLSGKPDETPPKLTLPRALNPLSRVDVTVSEELKSASLALTGTTVVPLAAQDGTGQLSAFFNSTVLPFGGTWKITGHGQDYAGLPLDLSTATVTTIDDPGIFVQDGFESQPIAEVSSDVVWIDASSGLPIPSGSRALFVPPNDAAIFHLRRTNASSKVSVRVVGLLTGANSESAIPDFQAAVIGGTNRVRDHSAQLDAALATSHPTWTLASAPRTVELELTDTGTDAVVTLYPYSCSYFGCRRAGALIIDDLKFE